MQNLETVPIMETKNKYRIILFLCLGCIFASYTARSQHSYAGIFKATCKKGLLKITFINTKDELVYAPDLAMRKGINNRKIYQKYWDVKGDTLMLNSSSSVSKDLYTLINREGGTTSAVLTYNDPLLQPGKKRTYKVKIDPIPENIRFLRFGVFLIPLSR